MRDEALEVTFEGGLVYLNGVDLSVIDGHTGKAVGLGELEGELGWSDFIQLSGKDSVVYESLVSEVPGVRLGMQDGTDDVLLDEISAIHELAGRTLLVSDAEDLHIIDLSAPDSAARPLDVGPCLSALLSNDAAEVAYVQGIPTDESDATTGELEQRLMVRATDGSEDESEVSRGWHAIEPLLLDADSLLIADYPFGGVDTADLVLIDRRSSESTTVASDVTILDSDKDSRSVAIASLAADDSVEGVLSILRIDHEGSAVTTRFEGVAVETLTAASLRPDGTGLIAAFSHEDGATTVVALDQGDDSQRTIAEWAATRSTGVLVHPDGQTAFLVLEVDSGTTPMEAERSIVVCDLVERTTAELVPPGAGELVRLVGVR